MCGDNRLSDPATYDTMTRIGGSYDSIADVFKLVAEQYGWMHIVLISDDDITSVCWYAAKPLNDLFANDDNYTLTWLRLALDPTDHELDSELEQIRKHSRGDSLILYRVAQKTGQPISLQIC